MMNCVAGSARFNLRTASTPFIPGRLMSINTTSGFFSGRSLSALSASPHSPASRKPEARPIQPAIIFRAWGSSSTIETATDMAHLYITLLRQGAVICFDDAPGPGFDHHHEFGARTLPGRGLPFTAAADFAQPLLHVRQTVAEHEPLAVCGFQGRSLPRRAPKSATIVRNHQHEAFRTELQGKAHFRGLRVFHHIVQCLFEG